MNVPLITWILTVTVIALLIGARLIGALRQQYRSHGTTSLAPERVRAYYRHNGPAALRQHRYYGGGRRG